MCHLNVFEFSTSITCKTVHAHSAEIHVFTLSVSLRFALVLFRILLLVLTMAL